MSYFKIIDKSGIKLKTANTYVTEDLAVTLTDNDINNIVPENIAKNVTILGVTGTFEDNSKPEQSKTVEFNPGSADSITITPDEGYVLSSIKVGKPATMIPENIKKGVDIGGVVGTNEGGITIQPVTNLTLSDGVLSWNSPDISELTNKGYTVILGYDVYINNELKLNTTTTSVSIVEHLIKGENTIKVITKAEVKYFESNGNEIVVLVEPTVTTLSITLPKAIDDTSAVVINNKAYMFGGNSIFNDFNTILEFDPTTNTVTTLSATLPNKTSSTSAVAINNKAYVFGGEKLNTILEFDPTTNTVTTLSVTLPQAMDGASAVAINNKGYIFGGWSSSGVFNTILEFDPITNTVTTLSATLPKAMHGTSAVAIDNKAYIFGGADDMGRLNTILEFDLTTNIITTLSVTLPQAILGTSAVAIDNKAYIFGGGINSDNLSNTILEFDPITNTVTTLSATLPIAMVRTSAVAIDNKAYIFGGEDSSGKSKNTILRIDNLG